MQIGFFDVNKRLERLDKLNDPLKVLLNLIDFEIFREEIEKGLEKERKDNSGRKPFDKVMLFKGLIIKRLYDLSNDELEFQITDRTTFRRFLGIDENAMSPDANTFWLFSDELSKNGIIDKLFAKFDEFLNNKGYTAQGGTMIDASFVEVPKQRNTKEENKEIKEGKIPQSFTKNVHRFAQKDTDARWTKKGDVNYYGYKNHVNADVKYKFVRNYEVTSAEVHDSQPFISLLMEYINRNSFPCAAWADSAYMSDDLLKFLASKGIQANVNERAYRNKPLTEEQKADNRIKSRTRARVEHIFGFMENTLSAGMIRTIGIIRAKSQVALINLTYNLFRFCQLEKAKSLVMA
jgi:transposase, IS5 family